MSGYTPRRTVFTPVSTHRIHGVAKKGAAEAQNQAQQKDAKGGSEWHEWTTNPEGTRVLPFHAKRDLSLQKDKAEGEGFELSSKPQRKPLFPAKASQNPAHLLFKIATSTPP